MHYQAFPTPRSANVYIGKLEITVHTVRPQFGYPERLIICSKFRNLFSEFGATLGVTERHNFMNDVSLSPIANAANVIMISSARSGIPVRCSTTHFSVVMVCRTTGTKGADM